MAKHINKHDMVVASDFVRALADALDVSQKRAKEICELYAAEIKETVGNGLGVILPGGLGQFVVSDRAARKSRNPRTGEPIVVPAGTVVKFKVTSALKKAVNQGK